MVDLLEPMGDRTMEGFHEAQLGGGRRFRCADCLGDGCRSVSDYSPKDGSRDYEVGAVDPVVNIVVPNTLRDRSHHGNSGSPDNNIRHDIANNHPGGVEDYDSMVALVGSGDSYGNDLIQGGSPRWSGVIHPPRVVQRLYFVVVVAHLVANDLGVAQFGVVEPS